MINAILIICLSAICLAAEPPRQFFANSGEWQGDYVFNTDNSKVIPLKSSFTAEYTDEALILKVDYRDADVARLKAFKPGKDGDWPLCDCIEIFFSPKQDHSFIQLGIGVNGQRFDTRWESLAKTTWTSEVKIDDGGWTAVVTLPFSDPGFSVPAKGDVWGFNICRDVFPSNTSMYYSSWARCGLNFRVPAKFGELVFGTREEAREAMMAKFDADITAISEKLKNAGIYDQFAARLDAIRNKGSVQELNDFRDEAEMIVALKLLK